MKFEDIFRAATRTDQEPAGRSDPFQGRLAEANPLPHLVRAPIAAGKTATAVLG